jgi:hypothetical protein
VNENDLVADIGAVLPMSKQGPAAGKVLDTDDMAALFGLDMGDVPERVEVVAPMPVKKAPGVRKKNESGSKAVAPKVAPAKKAVRAGTETAAGARAGARAPKQVEPKPVEWWKPAPAKQVANKRVSPRDPAGPSAKRKVRAAS